MTLDEAALHRTAEALYAGPPEDFVAARTAAAKQLRAAGDRATAAAVGELRRPTVPAWAVNLLVRRRGDLVDELVSLGAALREAQATLDAATLRELTRQRRRVVTRVAAEARSLVEDEGGAVSAAAQRQVEDTLQAALVDADLAAVLQSGLLVQPLSSTGVDSLADVQAIPGAPRLSVVRGGTDDSADSAAGEQPDADAEADRAAEEEAARRAALVAERARLQDEQRSGRSGLRQARRALQEAEQQVAAAEAALREARSGRERAAAAQDAAEKVLATVESALADLDDALAP